MFDWKTCVVGGLIAFLCALYPTFVYAGEPSPATVAEYTQIRAEMTSNIASSRQFLVTNVAIFIAAITFFAKELLDTQKHFCDTESFARGDDNCRRAYFMTLTAISIAFGIICFGLYS